MTKKAIRAEIKADLQKRFGAFVTVKQVTTYTGKSRTWVDSQIAGCVPVAGKSYYCGDIAEVLVK